MEEFETSAIEERDNVDRKKYLEIVVDEKYWTIDLRIPKSPKQD